MTHLNLAFIGFGNHVVNHHAPYLVENCSDIASIVAISDVLEKDIPFADACQKQLRLSNVPCYPVKQTTPLDPSDVSTIEELLAEHPDLDAAIISTPHTKHYHQVKRCLQAGLHVLVDKPLALSYEQAKELVDLAKGSECQLVVASQRRYEDTYQYAKRAVDMGELGEATNVDFIASHADDWLQGWHADPKWAGGGALWGNGWHVVDTIVYLVNKKAIAVDGSLYFADDMAVETHATALIHFEGGLTATVTVNYRAPRNIIFERLQLWGTKGILILERFKPRYDNQEPVVIHQLSDGHLLA